ncbi:MAG: hypothetical protein JWM16_2100 [Verrucomicrobiales bacterium]|nr:hypothetical protein [Verrucomicrobiales bacterium]
MCYFQTIAAAFLLSGFSAFAQFTLNPGETWSYHFNSLPFVGVTNAFSTNPQGVFSFKVNGSTLQPDDMLQYEMFETSAAESPVCAGTMTGASSLLLSCSSPGAWGDRQGAIKFTMLSGSVSVDSISVEAIASGPSLSSLDVYSSTFVPAPEPRVSVLAVSSILVGFSLRRNFPKRSTPSN